MSDNEGIGMGEKLTLSATQLVLLCDNAIEKFMTMLQEYQEKEESGCIMFSQPDTLEAARDAVIELFKEQKEESND